MSWPDARLVCLNGLSRFRVQSATTRDGASIMPAKPSMPGIERRTRHQPGRTPSPAACQPGVVLSNAVRSRSTACLSCRRVSTAESGPSRLCVGARSVSRSSSDGAAFSPLPNQTCEFDLADIHQCDFAHIRHQHTLTERQRPFGAGILPFCLMRQGERRIGRRRRSWISCRDEAKGLSIVAPGEVCRHPHLIAQVGGRFEPQGAQSRERNPKVAAVDERLEHGSEPWVGIGNPGARRVVERALAFRRSLERGVTKLAARSARPVASILIASMSGTFGSGSGACRDAREDLLVRSRTDDRLIRLRHRQRNRIKPAAAESCVSADPIQRRRTSGTGTCEGADHAAPARPASSVQSVRTPPEHSRASMVGLPFCH